MKKSAENFANMLMRLSACREAREWSKGKSLAEAWKTCERGDWMLWLCGKMVDQPGWPTHKEVVLAACDCAELSLKHVRPAEERPRKCLETVRAWAAGKATIEDVREARRAAYASAAYASAAYAAYASAASADAADAAASAASASAADAADAAASDAAYAARGEVRTKTLKKCTVLVRKSLKVSGVKRG